MNCDNILEHLLGNPEADVDPMWVKEYTDKFPACYLPAALLLKRAPQSVDDEILKIYQKSVILGCANSTALTDFVDPMNMGWDNFYPQHTNTKIDTLQTIDDFISTYGKSTSSREDAVLEKILFNPVAPEYFSVADETYDSSSPLRLPPELAPKPDDFPPSQTAPSLPPSATATEETVNKTQHHDVAHTGGDETLLRESLAKIFIKQHRYERAFEIISKLSLNYPEKSVYFADQLRFLQKLIINQQYLEKNK